MSGRIEALWIKRASCGVMDPVSRARVVTSRGLEGNADQGGARQVTLIEREVFDRLRDELSPEVDPVHRRANVLLSGIRLAQTRDRVLKIGNIRIRIRGETRPCARMDEAVPGLRDALDADWGAGVFGEVMDDGEIAVGDAVRWDGTP